MIRIKLFGGPADGQEICEPGEGLRRDGRLAIPHTTGPSATDPLSPAGYGTVTFSRHWYEADLRNPWGMDEDGQYQRFLWRDA